MTLADQTLRAVQDGESLPVAAVADQQPLFERIRRGGVADARQLLGLAQMLRTAHALRGFAAARRNSHAELAAALTSDPELDVLLDRLELVLEADGTISDAASTELSKARRRVQETRRELVARLVQLTDRYASVLRDRYYAERDGRYVLPVRADAHLRVPGIVLGSSGSGVTLYVEPQEITVLGNQLRVALAAVEREEARVLAALSEQAAGCLGELEQAHAACIEADLLAAIAGWASEVRALALLPESESVLELASMRHPLLVGPDSSVVANDMQLRENTVLVISGPNAGGKTVALKCLGLAAWMARAGIPLPVGPGSRVGWFDPVLTDVGDEQSLLRSLSTFSAHIANLARILEQSCRHTLVLLDEATGGTDPEEGSALAAAVLEALLERGATVAVTTHYERLKQLAAHDERFHNASVGFDSEQMAPTFRLTLGVPGASSALQVAVRFGIPSNVIDRARALLPEGAVEVQQLASQLQSERDALRTARAEAEQAACRQAELLAQIETERSRVRDRERQRLAVEGRELAVAVRQARDQLRAASQRLRQGSATKQALREAQRSIDRAAHQVALGSPLARATARTPLRSADRAPRVDQLEPGVEVYLTELGTHAQVIEPPARGQVRVLAGAVKLVVPVTQLEFASHRNRPGASPSKRSRRSGGTAAGRAPSSSARSLVRTKENTVDLRGERVDDALALLDAFLDRMLAANEPAGFVLHGHGSGRLKDAVRAHLAASPYVERAAPAEPEDGGDAFSVFWIRG
jgi:DNA mismatch repair protein MutS2